eukprot:scaffold1762_cov128-Cylindrotheca_fusiformis.AAC.1
MSPLSSLQDSQMGHSCPVAAPVAVDVDIAGIAAVDTDTDIAAAAADIEEQQLKLRGSSDSGQQVSKPQQSVFISLADAGFDSSLYTQYVT